VRVVEPVDQRLARFPHADFELSAAEGVRITRRDATRFARTIVETINLVRPDWVRRDPDADLRIECVITGYHSSVAALIDPMIEIDLRLYDRRARAGLGRLRMTRVQGYVTLLDVETLRIDLETFEQQIATEIALRLGRYDVRPQVAGASD